MAPILVLDSSQGSPISGSLSPMCSSWVICNTSSANGILPLKPSICMGLQQRVHAIESDGYLRNVNFYDLAPCNAATRIAHDLRGTVKAMGCACSRITRPVPRARQPAPRSRRKKFKQAMNGTAGYPAGIQESWVHDGPIYSVGQYPVDGRPGTSWISHMISWSSVTRDVRWQILVKVWVLESTGSSTGSRPAASTAGGRTLNETKVDDITGTALHGRVQPPLVLYPHARTRCPPSTAKIVAQAARHTSSSNSPSAGSVLATITLV
ncbi:hypothetical protein B0H13DRAFT_1903647 [Mycena leptocephala]|nr:hypothetical protein B0H13DRAFT_1903647 [Mycena leptocephala]